MGVEGAGERVGVMAESRLDLHEYMWKQAKAIFIENYNQFLSEKQTGSIEIIHGYGSTGEEGIIRTRLRKLLERYASHLEFRLGEDIDSDIGHTFVFPAQPLPDDEDVLLEDMVEYCSIPRTEKKISGKFVKRVDMPKIRQTVRLLEKQGRLEKTLKNNQPMYLAT